jgi:hypothetical protein
MQSECSRQEARALLTFQRQGPSQDHVRRRRVPVRYKGAMQLE